MMYELKALKSVRISFRDTWQVIVTTSRKDVYSVRIEPW